MKRPAVITNPDIRALWDAIDAMRSDITELRALTALADRPVKRARKNMVEGGDA